MQRREFIQKSGLSGIALTFGPAMALSHQEEVEYGILELMGKVDIELHGKGINLRKEAHDAFVEMKKAAYSDGIDIKIISSYRSFDRQEAIWERKYLKYTEEDGMEPLPAIDKIIEYSTIPGTSRHHWGTDIDVIDGYPEVGGDVLVPGKFENGGPFENFKIWMGENSEKFGFHLVYTNVEKRRGFKYEPWHYSYAPLSIPMLKEFRSKNIMQILEKEQFEGSAHFTTGFIKNYVRDNILDINTSLL